MLQSTPRQLLLIDDDALALDAIATRLSGDGWNVQRANSAAKAIRDLREVRPEVVCTKLEMSTLNGRHVLRAVHGVDMDLPVVVYTDELDLPTAVELMRAGAFDCLGEPLNYLDDLSGVLERASRHAEIIREKRALQAELDEAQSNLARHLEQEAVIRQRALDNITKPLESVVDKLQQLKGNEYAPAKLAVIEEVLDTLFQVQEVLTAAEHDSTLTGARAVTLIDFHLQRVVEFARDAMLTNAHERKIELGFFVPGELPPLRGDPQQLRRALVGLLTFLVERKEEGSAQVSVHVVSRGPGPWVVRFDVGDHEGSVAPESDNQLHKYLPGDNPGLVRDEFVDLSLVSRAVGLLGGDLEFREERGVGSMFSFELIFLKAKRDTEALDDPGLPPAEVLVVESNPVVRRSVTNELIKLGLRCASASSTDQALQILKRAADGTRPFRIVFISLSLPDRTQIEAWLSEMEGEAPTRVYLARVGEFAATADGYVLMRPPRRDDLIRVLQRSNLG